MIEHDDFLVEIGTEELPPKALHMLSRAFLGEIEKGLDGRNLDHGDAESFATPRRLAVKVRQLAVRQADQIIERRGPAVSAAFDSSGSPTKAAMGFANSCGVEIDALSRLKTDKGEWLSFNAEVAGKETTELIPEIIEHALGALPIPKRMRWGAGSAEFVRPVHWIVLLLGSVQVDATILGINSGATSRGHRFHAPMTIDLASADDYPAVLEETGFVIADFERRKEKIAKLANDMAAQNDGHAVIDPALLDEVTALVEWPVPVCGSFDQHFLELPREVLIASMQDHQKYFPVESPNGTLTNKFITISNIESTEQNAVRNGNERVIRPRLSDAAFFWDQDRKLRLEDRLSRLEGIVFEKRLGSIKDKTDRVAKLARRLAPEFKADAVLCARAALLSRCDLVTAMVGEFPALQGLMGGYYAQHDGEPAEVADALSEFYSPRFAGDLIPTTPAGRCVAYADKLDTLVGIFSVGSVPTGDKDPFALRRAALGCIRIALESDSPIGLRESIGFACDGYANVVETENIADKVLQFIVDRIRGYFAEQKIAGSVVEAVLAVPSNSPSDIQRRIEAVATFQRLPESRALAAANKRIANILRKNSIEGSDSINAALLHDPAEKALARSIESVSATADGFLQRADHAAYLKVLAELHDPINQFFDEVMVMCDDVEVRDNRIALLNKIRSLFTSVADVARLND